MAGLLVAVSCSDGTVVGGDRISKLDHDALEVLTELPLDDRALQTAAEAEIAILDGLAGVERANAGIVMATRYLLDLTGIYYVLDADNTLFVGGPNSIEGWVVVVERDFSNYAAIEIVGAQGASDHYEALIEMGFKPGSADWVRNSIAVDEDGGIYVVSAEHMHKVMWDGKKLSTDPTDGAWTEPYRSSLPSGSGATPTLMGFRRRGPFRRYHRR